MQDSRIIQTSCGRVRGAQIADGLVFKGIPYASPPVGNLRFRPPTMPASWDGVRDCTSFGPSCPQSLPGNALLGPISVSDPFSEDCLSLNVWTPAADDGKRATLVWIHGGGFRWGGTSPAVYDGSSFARDDLVMVSINYRLGALGFLYLDEFFGDVSGSGNAGLVDQMCALEWVRENIDRFGGDSSNVTIFGESAGGFLVADLMAAPAASGLFHRTIVQSGGPWANSLLGATAVTERALNLLDVRPGELDRLQDIPASRLVDVTDQLRTEAAALLGGELRYIQPHPFLPVVDGLVLMDYPEIEIAKGRAAGVDLLIGWCANESNVNRLARNSGILEAGFRGQLQPYLSKRSRSLDEALTAYRELHPDRAVLDLLSHAHSDAMYRVPSIKLAEAQVRLQDSVWLYEFAWPTPVGDGRFGSPHTLEIPFVFDQLVAPALHGHSPPRGLATDIHGAWVQFAKTGRPGHGETSDWPRYITGGDMMVLNEAMSSRKAIHRDVGRIWEPFLARPSRGGSVI
jgi:para-nitrobenzyl esterase